MSCQSEFAAMLPFYASEALGDRERRELEAHLAGCAECRTALAFWQAVGAAVVAADDALPAPSPAVLEGALARLGEERSGMLARAWQLLLAQVPLVRREIWLASAMVMALGYVGTIAGGGGEARFIEAIAPLVAAAGIAMIYGAEVDPGLELALATPTPPRQVLLARLVLVFAYDLVLALVATAGLIVVLPRDPLGTIVVNWLAPMTFLSALALVLSMRIGAGSAATVALLLWLSRWLGRGMAAQALFSGDVRPPAMALAIGYERLWTNEALLFLLAAGLVALSLWMAGREESFLSRGAQVG